MYTWGISGPQFLLIYLVLLAVTVLGVVLARRRALAADGAAVPARLDLYEIAELSGGGALVATTAVSSLLRKGGLTSSSRRRGQPARLVAGTAPGPQAHPVEWAVYQQGRGQPEPAAQGRPGRPGAGAGPGRGPGAAAPGAAGPGPGAAGPLPGRRPVVRAPARPGGGPGGRREGQRAPVGFLVATVVVAAVFLLRVPNATELGRRTLRELRAANPRPAAGASPAELSMATALFGAGVLWAADTDTALLLRVPREHGAFAGDWGGGDGGGGGCGGGGCGGGGCGG
jgi:hypothetical protein